MWVGVCGGGFGVGLVCTLKSKSCSWSSALYFPWVVGKGYCEDLTSSLSLRNDLVKTSWLVDVKSGFFLLASRQPFLS